MSSVQSIGVWQTPVTTDTEAADYRYKCSRDDILYDMDVIDQWYNESLQALERRKETKRQSKRNKRNNCK